MACVCVSVSHRRLTNKKFILDNESDVTSLPKCTPGSIAIVAAGGKVFMVNASGQWVEAGQATFSMAEEVLF